MSKIFSEQIFTKCYNSDCRENISAMNEMLPRGNMSEKELLIEEDKVNRFIKQTE